MLNKTRGQRICYPPCYFPPIFIIWKENHPLKTPKPDVIYADLPIDNVRFLFSRNCTVLTLRIFHHQITASLPYNATEIENFSNTIGFIGKKSWIFFKNR